MNPAIILKIAAPATVALLVLLGAGVYMWTSNVAAQSQTTYQKQRGALNAQIEAANRQGYTAQDLEPIISQERTIGTGAVPWWAPARPGYYQGLTTQTNTLQGRLNARLKQLMDQAQADANTQVGTARTEIAQAQQANASDIDVQAFQTRFNAATQAQAGAKTIKDFRAVAQLAHSLANDATVLAGQVQQENQAIQAAGQQLAAANAGNIGTIQSAGNAAVSNARNDASVAAYMNKGSMIKGFDVIQRAENRLEKYATMIGSGDINQSALGTAGVQHFQDAIHSALIGDLPAKAVIVNWTQQHLWSYENGKVVMDTPVTTGIQGKTDFGTDFGPMKVLWTSHPWTMHSPWPKGSPYYYPDTVVQWTTFFTNTGESIHDAYWESDSQLGPGSQFNSSTRSHGCIHVPAGDAQWMFNWAQVGMPVIVYLGDGSSVDNQLAQITTDNQGNPLA